MDAEKYLKGLFYKKNNIKVIDLEDEKELECFVVNGKVKCLEPEVNIDADCNICGDGTSTEGEKASYVRIFLNSHPFQNRQRDWKTGRPRRVLLSGRDPIQ